MEKCGCVGLRVNNDSVIKYCPLHGAAPLLLAALTEQIPDGKGETFADNLDVIAGLVGHLGYDWTERAIRKKAQAIRAAIAHVKGESSPKGI